MEEPTAPEPKRATVAPWLILGLGVLTALVITNLVLLNRVVDLQDQLDTGLATVDASVSQLAGSLGNLSQTVEEFDSQLDNVQALAGPGEVSAAPDPGVQVGSGLPRFDPAIPDAAIGVQISGMDGPEYYTGQTLEIDAADGKARAWLVWAHWCPYCQAEMPELKEWVETNAAAFPDFELVSLTTAIDPSRGNPLEAYLDELQLPFPVIVDEDGSLSAQLGLNAFPFWVFTGPDGTVLGRSAGLLGPERFASIAQQLQDIAATA